MASQIRVISSMATKKVLGELVALYEAQPGACKVSVESVGGVDAARRVRAGEAFDAVVLAAETIDQLTDAGHIVPGSRTDLVRSGVSMAVRAGTHRPAIATEDEVKRAVLAAPRLSYSTGPSGVHLVKLFERWGIAAAIKDRIVQAPPGVPVGSLVADGRVDLGFQQLAELMNLPGIDVIGPLPPAIQIITTFAGGVSTTSADAPAARSLLAFLASTAAAPTKRANGMEPA